jgi:hypothetical protein
MLCAYYMCKQRNSKAAAQSLHIRYGCGYLLTVSYCIDSRFLLPFMVTTMQQYYSSKGEQHFVVVYSVHIYFPGLQECVSRVLNGMPLLYCAYMIVFCGRKNRYVIGCTELSRFGIRLLVPT